MPIVVDIVEDNPQIARLLKDFITGDEFSVRAIYYTAEDMLAKVHSLPLPDLVLMDIGLPGMSGIELTRALLKTYPTLEIVVQTVFEDPATIIEAIKAGVAGYVLKAAPRSELKQALRESVNGKSLLSGKVARHLLKEFQKIPSGRAHRNSTLDQSDLTEREKEVMTELSRGAAYKEIAVHLDISVHTVGNHIRKIYEKLKVRSRGEAVALLMNAE
jgi:DNA-binding NarL/FixJ family response regulator